MLVAVDLSNMPEQSGEDFLVGIEDILRESAGYLQRFTRCCHSPWETLRVSLEPQRSIAAHGVLPRAEPQEHDFQIVLPSHIDGLIDKREVILALLGLSQIPLGGHKNGVQSQPAHPWQHTVDVGFACCRRVAEFPGKHQHLPAIDRKTPLRSVSGYSHLSRRWQCQTQKTEEQC